MKLRKSYRNLAVRWHPDRFRETLKKKEVEKKMKLINHAFDIIGNEESKQIYDFCHQLTDVLPVFEDKRGFFSKLLNINHENAWNKCYEDDYQYTGTTTREYETSNDSTANSSENDKSSNSSKNDQSYSFDSNEMDSSKTENTSESDDSIFGWKALIIRDNNLFFSHSIDKKSFYTYYNKSNYTSYANYCQFSISI